jgi:hypothetical protein
MFDSENVSLVTRIEAGDGVTVTHSTNLEGENIWTAAVDEAWLTAWVNANSSGALKLNDSDSLRIKALENALGINANSTVAAPVVVAGTSGTTQITIAADVTVLSGPLTMSYNIRGIDNTVLVTETMTVATGSSPAAILMTMYAQMRANTNMTKFMAPTYVSADNMLVLTWNTANVGSTFSYSITTQTSGDNVVLTATDY